MRTERTMPSSAMLRLFMTDCSAWAFRLAPTRANSVPTEMSMTTAKSATATIISTSVKPREPYLVFGIWYLVRERNPNPEIFCLIRDTRYDIRYTALLHRYLSGRFDDDAHADVLRRGKDDASPLVQCYGVENSGGAVRADVRVGLGSFEEYIERTQAAGLDQASARRRTQVGDRISAPYGGGCDEFAGGGRRAAVIEPVGERGVG